MVPRIPVDLITRDFEPHELKVLVSDDSKYGFGLRTLVLRILLSTPAALKLTQDEGRTANPVVDFLGLDNYERYISGRTLWEVKKRLSELLLEWECRCDERDWIPATLEKNIKNLTKIVALSKVEQSILALSVLVHAEPVLERAVDLMGSDLSGFSLQRPLAAILQVTEQEVQEALSRDGRLFQSGLLTIELRGRYDLKQLLDLLTPTFHSRMVVPQTDIRNLVSGFVNPATKANLTLDSFSHMAKLAPIVREHLQQSVLRGRSGVNLLIYGPPGTGKSQFARAIAEDLGLDLLEVSPTNLAGTAVAPIRRIRNYRIAQSFYQNSSTILLFDEVEEVFTINGNDRSDDEATVPKKSFLNTLLESNKVPTLWIANRVSEFDVAYLRRFDICIEMPIPPRSKRLCMLQDAFQGSISNKLSKQIASHDKVSPALIHQVAKVIGNLTSCTTIAEREQHVVQLINEQLRAQGAREMQYNSQQACERLNFDPDLIHCVENLKQLIEGLKATGIGRLCLYGPPGTGKTAFGKWVAESLDLPHRVVSGATLRGPYVGDTEKNIARTFALAKSENAVLQLDEADTFLADRRRSLQAHEVAHINEMLVQMENYEGIFIASTNLVDNLDDAALRRFDLALKFDYLTPDSVLKLFRSFAMLLGVHTIDQKAIQRIRNLRCLTPGDFDQAHRRSRLTGIKDINNFIEAMEHASQLKRAAGYTKPIGFLRAA